MWEELKEVEGRAGNCLEDDLSSLSRRDKRSFFPLLRHKKDVREQHVKAFSPLNRDSFQSIYLTTDSMADSGQLPVHPILGALKENDRGSERWLGRAERVFPCLLNPRLITFSIACICYLFILWGEKVVSNFPVQYIFEHYITHFYVTGS